MQSFLKDAAEFLPILMQGLRLTILVTIGSLVLSTLPGGEIPEQLAFRTDARMLGFIAAVSLTSALLFAVAPAWRATRTNLVRALRE